MTTYRTTPENILYTVLDTKLLKKLAKQYQNQIDKLYNEEEQIQVRKIKTKIGKEFLIPINNNNELSKSFDMEKYIERNLTILKELGVNSFLSLHGWTMNKLTDYFTKNNGLLKPINKIDIM